MSTTWYMALDYHKPQIKSVEVVKQMAHFIEIVDPAYKTPFRTKRIAQTCSYFPSFEEAKAWLDETISRRIQDHRLRLEQEKSRLDLVRKLAP